MHFLTTITQIEGLEPLPAALLIPWPQEARAMVRNLLCEAPTESRNRFRYVEDEATLARFFSMPLPYRLAAMSTPRHERDIDTSSRIGITTVLTLTEEEPLDPAWFRFKRITNVFVPVPNYKAPSIAEMDFIYKLFQQDRDGFWMVHCGGGKGRAGTVLTCLLAMHGSEDGTPQMDRSQAIDHIRKIRPGSIETSQQEEFVASWLSHRWKTAHTSSVIEEPYSTLEAEVNSKSFPTGVSTLR